MDCFAPGGWWQDSRDLRGVNMVPDTDRRIYPRAEIRWPVIIKTAQDTIEAKLRNLGVGGAYIHCDLAPEPGEIVVLTLKPPTGSSLEITAEVVWAGKVLALGMGVRFVEISDEDRQFIEKTISDLLGDSETE